MMGERRTQILNDIRTKSVGIGSGINHSFSATLFLGIPHANFFYAIAVCGYRDAQATGEAFSPQKRTSCTSKHENSLPFLCLLVIFALLDPDPYLKCRSRSSISN
jgi:hypothetical protein